MFGQTPVQDLQRRKPNPPPDAQAATPAEPTLRLRGGGADAKRKAARKRKFAQTEPAVPSTRTPEQQSGPEGSEAADPSASEQQSKKRKRKHEKAPSPSNGDGINQAHTPAGPDKAGAPLASQPTDAETADAKSQRFIVFIGNLPFTATTDSIRAHFAKVAPASIRHRTHKETGKSKGFAFLEFDGYDRMKTCLKLYHHSSFEDGVSAARKINVELTAGGGGAKSKERREKLQTKNEKLNEERKRRALEEEKANGKAGKETGKGAGADDAGDVHPSRRARVPKG